MLFDHRGCLVAMIYTAQSKFLSENNDISVLLRETVFSVLEGQVHSVHMMLTLKCHSRDTFITR